MAAVHNLPLTIGATRRTRRKTSAATIESAVARWWPKTSIIMAQTGATYEEVQNTLDAMRCCVTFTHPTSPLPACSARRQLSAQEWLQLFDAAFPEAEYVKAGRRNLLEAENSFWCRRHPRRSQA